MMNSKALIDFIDRIIKASMRDGDNSAISVNYLAEQRLTQLRQILTEQGIDATLVQQAASAAGFVITAVKEGTPVSPEMIEKAHRDLIRRNAELAAMHQGRC